MTRTGRVWISFVFFLIYSACAVAQTIWYEDNSFARKGGLPDDFVYKFENPESWKLARSKLNVYMFRPNMFGKNYPQITDEFLVRYLIPVLKGSGIEVALDTSASLLSGCRDRAGRIKAEMGWVARIKRAGLHVNYISLQSLLSKPHREDGEVRDCPIADRVKAGIAYAKQLAEIYPGVEIGIIDALPSKGLPYKEPYKYTRDMFWSEKIPLKFIHMDVSAEMIQRGINGLSWPKVIDVERYVKKLGLKFGLIFTSRRSGHISDGAFYNTILTALDEYRRAGGAADHYVIISWFPYPKQTVRRLGEVAGGYPVTDAIPEFSRRIGTHAPGAANQRRHAN
jgi:hypothetical protein